MRSTHGARRLADLLMRLDCKPTGKIGIASYDHFFRISRTVINERLPRRLFQGASAIGVDLKWATRLWELPADQQLRVHNYGIGRLTGRQFQLFATSSTRESSGRRHRRNLVVVGASYHSTGDGSQDPNQFFASIWRRYGFYTYSAQSGSHPTVNPLAPPDPRAHPGIRLREASLPQRGGSATHAAAHSDPQNTGRDRSGWGQQVRALRTQTAEFAAMVDYLHARGSGDGGVPAARHLGRWPAIRARLRAEMSEVVAESVIQDWSKVLGDEDLPTRSSKFMGRRVTAAIPQDCASLSWRRLRRDDSMCFGLVLVNVVGATQWL